MKPIKLMPLLTLSFAILIVSCTKQNRHSEHNTKSSTIQKVDSIIQIPHTESLSDDKPRRIKVMVIPCSNGYTYAQQGYDFNPLLEKLLKGGKDIELQPFPYKKMMGKIYIGVFDKKYAGPIIEKVDAHVLVMTQFIGGDAIHIGEESGPEGTWGYEVRILNTKTLQQVNSIGAKALSDYLQIEEHIQKNIEHLKTDILRIAT